MQPLTLPLLKYLAIESAVANEDGVTWLAEEAGVKKSSRRRREFPETLSIGQVGIIHAGREHWP